MPLSAGVGAGVAAVGSVGDIAAGVVAAFGVERPLRRDERRGLRMEAAPLPELDVVGVRLVVTEATAGALPLC